MGQQRNIGGSLFASSNRQILMPIEHPRGTLIVVPMPDADTHALVLRRFGQEQELVRHPNGFSCRHLAERIEAAWLNKGRHAGYPMEQFDYILRCGGAGDRVALILVLEAGK